MNQELFNPLVPALFALGFLAFRYEKIRKVPHDLGSLLIFVAGAVLAVRSEAQSSAPPQLLVVIGLGVVFLASFASLWCFYLLRRSNLDGRWLIAVDSLWAALGYLRLLGAALVMLPDWQSLVAGFHPDPAAQRTILVITAGLGLFFTIVSHTTLHGVARAIRNDGDAQPSLMGFAMNAAGACLNAAHLAILFVASENHALNWSFGIGPAIAIGCVVVRYRTKQRIRNLMRFQPGSGDIDSKLENHRATTNLLARFAVVAYSLWLSFAGAVIGLVLLAQSV